jgi:hypothetical protein
MVTVGVRGGLCNPPLPEKAKPGMLINKMVKTRVKRHFFIQFCLIYGSIKKAAKCNHLAAYKS